MKRDARLTIAVANQKGGVGKTNVAGNLAAELAAAGRNVVLIDLDPQATATTWALGRYSGRGTADVLLGDATAEEVLVDVPAFRIRMLGSVPEAMRIAERTIAANVGSERALSRAIRDLSADTVIFDCPPSMGVLTAAAFVAATGILVPVAAAPEALDGLVQLLSNLCRLRVALDLELPVLAIVPTRFDIRLRIAREVVDAVRALEPEALTDFSIRESVALRELFRPSRPDPHLSARFNRSRRLRTSRRGGSPPCPHRPRSLKPPPSAPCQRHWTSSPAP